jgi:hypothetical protein
MKIARHGFDPSISYANDWFAEVGVSEANSFEHGTRRRAVAPVGDSTAAMLEVHSD